MKRQRGRNRSNSNKNQNNPNRSLDSNGPDVKVRGSASTIYEKYTTLARDAQSSGNRVKAENYRQHAEHYLRLMNAQEAEKRLKQPGRHAETMKTKATIVTAIAAKKIAANAKAGATRPVRAATSLRPEINPQIRALIVNPGVRPTAH